VFIANSTLKNNFFEMLAYEGRYEKDNRKTLNAECTTTINTAVTRNPKTTVKKP
jgi:S-adenosylmethionine:diacylglycerol 3-amino-3-carboxypropyl transferase